jgi:hypothetical protein
LGHSHPCADITTDSEKYGRAQARPSSAGASRLTPSADFGPCAHSNSAASCSNLSGWPRTGGEDSRVAPPKGRPRRRLWEGRRPPPPRPATVFPSSPSFSMGLRTLKDLGGSTSPSIAASFCPLHISALIRFAGFAHLGFGERRVRPLKLGRAELLGSSTPISGSTRPWPSRRCPRKCGKAPRRPIPSAYRPAPLAHISPVRNTARSQRLSPGPTITGDNPWPTSTLPMP